MAVPSWSPADANSLRLDARVLYRLGPAIHFAVEELLLVLGRRDRRPSVTTVIPKARIDSSELLPELTCCLT